MDRDTFRTLAAGKYAISNLEGTIDKSHMLSFIDGAIYAYDILKKQTTKGGVTNETKQDAESQDLGNSGKEVR